VCATTLAGNLEFALSFLQKGAYLKAYGVCGPAFCNISLAFNKTISSLHLMREAADVNITDFGKGTTLHYLHMTTTRNAYYSDLQLITI
jgi:hypothetical protein